MTERVPAAGPLCSTDWALREQCLTVWVPLKHHLGKLAPNLGEPGLKSGHLGSPRPQQVTSLVQPRLELKGDPAPEAKPKPPGAKAGRGALQPGGEKLGTKCQPPLELQQEKEKQKLSPAKEDMTVWRSR